MLVESVKMSILRHTQIGLLNSTVRPFPEYREIPQGSTYITEWKSNMNMVRNPSIDSAFGPVAVPHSIELGCFT